MTQLQDVAPELIESESFRIIEREFPERTGRRIDDYSAEEFAIIQRVIHATGDFSAGVSLVFQGDAISRALAAVRAGGSVITDVGMVAQGVSKPYLNRFGGRVLCRIGEEETRVLAEAGQTTRAEAAIKRCLDEQVAILAVGNAPTALLAALQAIATTFRPAVIVGVPVGFVNAAESKELLKESGYPAILLPGRRGGSPIAAAIVNALLRLAAR